MYALLTGAFNCHRYRRPPVWHRFLHVCTCSPARSCHPVKFCSFCSEALPDDGVVTVQPGRHRCRALFIGMSRTGASRVHRIAASVTNFKVCRSKQACRGELGLTRQSKSFKVACAASPDLRYRHSVSREQNCGRVRPATQDPTALWSQTGPSAGTQLARHGLRCR